MLVRSPVNIQQLTMQWNIREYIDGLASVGSSVFMY